jgi:1,2-phenylacetyl-CoA epoxidase catalytic subunit
MAVRLGIKRWENEEARRMYLEETIPLIEHMGLKAPDPLQDRRIL